MSGARFAGVVLLLAVAASWLAPAAAGATEVTAAEFRTLAREAETDPSALVELRAVDAVDGRPVDVRGALRGARGAALEARLQALAVAVTVPSAFDPRAEARDVLAEERFQEPRLPGPFREPLDWLGERLPDVSVPLDWVDDLIPGPRSVVWLVLVALCAAVGWVVARRVLTRRVGVATAARELAVAARDEDPRALERRADAAEAAGDLEAALRLRFRAGLLRLDARGAISFRPSISTHEVRRSLHSEDFDALAATFDDVVYGRRPPRPADVADSRDRWPAVVKDNVKGPGPFRER